ncbi:eukaryotic translation initiation factor 2D [Aphidius gifuensis]|uniref:eukaryotic translation initiation factor 2D n=1 Tax=Aphidius gifuensis TaxID=684658 RepID=UPI001CDD38B7|nr:eukaryotic translation initiation factor 2D [Aphidius gifuensis]
MFIKPFKVKSNNQLKGTERKKLCEDVLISFPNLSDADVQALLPKKETISSMKIITHGGELCKLYCVAKVPMFFQLDQPNLQLFPTIFTLWQHPDLLYYYTTYPPVVSKLANGAHLMLPGVVLNGPTTIKSYGKLEKNTPVAINTDDNKAAVAVGVTSHSSEEMYMCGGRGKCVDVIHVIGDALCQLGKPPTRPQIDDKSDTPTVNEDSTSDIVEDLNTAAIDDDINDNKNDDINENNIVTTPPEINNLDPIKEMDKLLEYCFLKACKIFKKNDLPILSSSFFKNHLIAACPSDQIVDVKKSSFKKLSAFLAYMVSKGVINTTIIKGVESITQIQSSNPLIRELVINETAEPSKPVSSNTPVVSECFRVTADVLPILSKFGYEKGDVMKRVEIRKCFMDYVKKENLQDGKMMNINPQLAGTLRTKENVLSLTIEDGINKFIGKMTHTHEITVGNTTLLHTGKLEPIDITVTTRCNNKKVTLINNLETFGIKLDEFSKECQGIGASATITDVPGKKTPNVLVQGNQVLYVYKLLTEKYRINKNHIKGLEFAPKKKK